MPWILTTDSEDPACERLWIRQDVLSFPTFPVSIIVWSHENLNFMFIQHNEYNYVFMFMY